MSNTQMTTGQSGQTVINPFQRTQAEHLAAGTVAIEESRATAEAQGKLVIAKRFPRNEAKAYAAVMDACKRRGLAEEATYAFPRGGKTVTGPTIRLAEELARNWGNLDYGIRELSRKEGVSEMEAYAWDLETNTISSQKFTVRHIRDKSDGGGPVTSERDIYELTANNGARRLRARILAILPPDLVEDALIQCRETMKGNASEPIGDRVKKVIKAFDRFGVTPAMLEARVGKPLDQMLPDDFAELTEIRNSLKSGNTTAGDWFKTAKEHRASDVLDAPADAADPAPATPAPAAAPKPATAKRTQKAAPPVEDTKSPAKAEAQEQQEPEQPASTPTAPPSGAPSENENADDVF